jgi:hypothetical protein
MSLLQLETPKTITTYLSTVELDTRHGCSVAGEGPQRFASVEIPALHTIIISSLMRVKDSYSCVG